MNQVKILPRTFGAQTVKHLHKDSPIYKSNIYMRSPYNLFMSSKKQAVFSSSYTTVCAVSYLRWLAYYNIHKKFKEMKEKLHIKKNNESKLRHFFPYMVSVLFLKSKGGL